MVKCEENDNFKIEKEAYTGGGIIINSKFLDGLKVPQESIVKTIDIIEEKNGKGYGNALRTGINQVKTEFFCIFNDLPFLCIIT